MEPMCMYSKMRSWSLSCGWMEIRFNFDSYVAVCICYPQVRLLECLPRELALHFTVCLLTNCSSDVNTTAKCWCILPKGTYYLNVWVNMLDFILLSYQRGFWKSVTLKMGYWSLSCGWMEIYSTLLLTSLSVYVTHRSGCWNVFPENLHFISQSVFLQTVLVMWKLQLSVGVYYLRE
jgi:hypothetical protein